MKAKKREKIFPEFWRQIKRYHKITIPTHLGIGFTIVSSSRVKMTTGTKLNGRIPDILIANLPGKFMQLPPKSFSIQ
jgi:hypothetical protein